MPRGQRKLHQTMILKKKRYCYSEENKIEKKYNNDYGSSCKAELDNDRVQLFARYLA